MNLSLKRYVALTKRSIASIAEETGHSSPAITGMLSRKSPVFVRCKQGDDYKQIEELYRYEVLFSAAADHKESS